MRRTSSALPLMGTMLPVDQKTMDFMFTIRWLDMIKEVTFIPMLQGLSKHLFQFKFDAVRSFLDRDRKEEDVNEFVSAVCWKANSNVMVAANSQGTIKVLELV